MASTNTDSKRLRRLPQPSNLREKRCQIDQCQGMPNFSADFGQTWWCHGHWLIRPDGQEMAMRNLRAAHSESP